MILILPLLVCFRLLVPVSKRYALLFAVISLFPSTLWMIRDATIEAPAARSASGRLIENVLIGVEPDFNLAYRDPSDPRGQAARLWVGKTNHLYYENRRAAIDVVTARILDEPLRYTLWFLQKPFLLWSWSIGQGAGDLYIYPMLSSPFEQNPLYRLIAAICHGLNVPLIAAAFAMILLYVSSIWRKERSDPAIGLRLCIWMFCYAEVVYTLLTPDARYANPFRPFELALAVTFVGNFLDYVRVRRRDHAATRGGLAITNESISNTHSSIPRMCTGILDAI
jgi:hypothetical protein